MNKHPRNGVDSSRTDCESGPVMVSAFKVSVIIPVFNATKFLRRAVVSALAQQETGEVILVEDGSVDDSLVLCGMLECEFPGRVRLIRHIDGGNYGAGRSRNVGIQAARFDYLAFLDADDYYLDNRFVSDREILSTDPSLDGVYDALGLDLSDDESGWWGEVGHHTGLVTLKPGIVPEVLLSEMDPLGISGSFTTDTILVHKRIFEKTQAVFSSLKFGEDTLLWMQFAACGRLAGGSLSVPVAMRGVHGGNSLRGLSDSRTHIGTVLESFEKWAADQRAIKGVQIILACAKIRFCHHWGEVFGVVCGHPRLILKKKMWQSLFRWAFIRQFPEDPVLPGLFPRMRRKQRRAV